MVIKLYISGISGNKEVKKKQQRVQMILDSKQISYEAIDITEPGKEKDKEFMQQNGKVRESLGKYPLPPQIFNDDDFCGDYEDFDMANEVDELEKFLHIATNTKELENETKVNGVQEQIISTNDTAEEHISTEVTESEVNGETEPVPTSESSNKVIGDNPETETLTEDISTLEKEEEKKEEGEKEKEIDNGAETISSQFESEKPVVEESPLEEAKENVEEVVESESKKENENENEEDTNKNEEDDNNKDEDLTESEMPQDE